MKWRIYRGKCYVARLVWNSAYQSFAMQIIDLDQQANEGASNRKPFLRLGGKNRPSITELKPLLEAAAPYLDIPNEIQELLLFDQVCDQLQRQLAAAEKEALKKTLARYYEYLVLLDEYQVLRTALDLFAVDRDDEALTELDKILCNKPNISGVVAIAIAADIYAAKGRGQRKLEYIEKACTFYRQAIELVAKNGAPPEMLPSLHVPLGLCLEKLDHFEEALQEYQYAIDTDPSCVQAWEARAECLFFRMHDLSLALASYDQVVRLLPGNAWAHYNRSRVLQALSRVEDAKREALMARILFMSEARHSR